MAAWQVSASQVVNTVLYLTTVQYSILQYLVSRAIVATVSRAQRYSSGPSLYPASPLHRYNCPNLVRENYLQLWIDLANPKQTESTMNTRPNLWTTLITPWFNLGHIDHHALHWPTCAISIKRKTNIIVGYCLFLPFNNKTYLACNCLALHPTN